MVDGRLEVLDEAIRPTPGQLVMGLAVAVEGHGEGEEATRTQHARELAKRRDMLREVLEDVEAEHVLEASIRERESTQILMPETRPECVFDLFARNVTGSEELATDGARVTSAQPGKERSELLAEIDRRLLLRTGALAPAPKRRAHATDQPAAGAGQGLAETGGIGSG